MAAGLFLVVLGLVDRWVKIWSRGKAAEAEAARASGGAAGGVGKRAVSRDQAPTRQVTPAHGGPAANPGQGPVEASDRTRSQGSSGAAAPVSSPALPTWLKAALHGALGDRYQDLAPLGSGGMGTVVRARDTRLERDVAIKVPPPHLAEHPDLQVRFLREAQALARLSHDNIGRVIDIPEVPAGEIPVMILEFLEGQDLWHYLDRHGPVPVNLGLDWICQAGRGLQHAHDHGILHRDIKPSNLMLVGDRIKILDFGLAALDDRRGLTKSGMLMGSMPYMPPEQLRGDRVDVGADLYALAVTAYQLLTGRLPFSSEDLYRLEVPRISATGLVVPPGIEAALEAAMAPAREDRFESVQEFLEALPTAPRSLG